jgi:hypothetical protein
MFTFKPELMMSKILPFRKKTPIVNTENGSSIIMEDCRFERNGIGMLLGEGVTVDMKGTNFLENGVGIIAGDLNEQILLLLKSSTLSERFKFAQELGEIKECSDPKLRSEIICTSTIGQKLSNLASIATVCSWLEQVIDGLSEVDLDMLLQLLVKFLRSLEIVFLWEMFHKSYDNYFWITELVTH